MHRRNITFTWEDDDEDPPKEVTDTRVYRFNLNEVEMIRFEAQYQNDGGWLGMMTAISAGRKNNSEILQFFEDLVSKSYGVKDGPEFVKTEELRNRFLCSPAYNALILEFIQGDSASILAEFIMNVLPKTLMTDEAKMALTAAAAEQKRPVVNTPPVPDAAPKG